MVDKALTDGDIAATSVASSTLNHFIQSTYERTEKRI